MTESKPSSKQVRTYQPTYRLNPKKLFDAENIQKILKRVVDAELVEIEYSEKVVPDMCLNLAEMLRNAVKEENYDRVPVSERDCEENRRWIDYLRDDMNKKGILIASAYNRYRIIVNVCIGQRRQQSVHVFHTFLWDHERDAFASYNYENPHIFANVVVYGVYLD